MFEYFHCFVIFVLWPVWGMSLRNFTKFTSFGSNLASVTGLKRIQTPHSLCCGFWADKTFTIRWSGRLRRQSSSLSPSSSPCLSPKSVPEGNRRFRGQNQSPSSWDNFPALLGRVGRSNTNTGRFRVGGSCCGSRQARLKKTCCHSCNPDSVQESKRFWWFANFGPRQALFFITWLLPIRPNDEN